LVSQVYSGELDVGLVGPEVLTHACAQVPDETAPSNGGFRPNKFNSHPALGDLDACRSARCAGKQRS
jgi:hypothetical protein